MSAMGYDETVMLNKITGYGSVKSTGNVKRRGGTSPVKPFSELLAAAETDDTAAVSSLSNVAATSAISNMLLLQEISDEDVRRRKLAQQGKNMLDELENLRGDLLMGIIPVGRLQGLARQLSIQKQEVADPKLAAIIDDIELRVAVELAKLEMAAKAP